MESVFAKDTKDVIQGTHLDQGCSAEELSEKQVQHNR